MKGSWRTTTLGILGLATIGIGVATEILNGKPVDWTIIIPTLMANLSAIFARDNKVTSAQAGAEPAPPTPPPPAHPLTP